MRRKIVAGNWKMNKTYEEGMILIRDILSAYHRANTNGKLNSVGIILIPPYILLQKARMLIGGMENFSVGAQNIHDKENGAYTGEISAKMLASFGAQYVIIGHSERRQYFGETNKFLASKITTALTNNLIPIYCVGETLQERENGNEFLIINKQLEEGIFHLKKEEILNCVIAYEPVWAIGTGKNATPEQAEEIHFHIREKITEQCDSATAEKIPVLYGGSVKANNARELFSQKNVDGGLVGGASLDAEEFVKIIQSAT